MCTYGHRAPVAELTPPCDTALAPYRVLLVEDDAEYGRMVERVLRRARPPLWVHREERLAAGLDRLGRGHYDALVMDLMLPDATGRATLENACAQASHLPVVVLTSTDDELLARDAIRSGAEDYLVKQRTHALTLPGALVRAIERHRCWHSARPTFGAFAEIADEVELLDQLARALARAERRGAEVGVMVAGFANLDGLREAFVPTAIERLIARAADRLALRVRGGDVLARLDDTRFAIVVEGSAGRRQLAQIAQGFRAVMCGLEIELECGVVLGLEAHVGISVYPEEGDDPETLLQNAAAAWHELGPHGGIQFFSSNSESP